MAESSTACEYHVSKRGDLRCTGAHRWDKVHGETLPYQAGYTALTWREPHGVTAHIVPWNHPMQIVGRSVGAALAMGNACVLKLAEEVCLTILDPPSFAQADAMERGQAIQPGPLRDFAPAGASGPSTR